MVRLSIPEPLPNIPLAPWFMPPAKHIFGKFAPLPPNFFDTQVERVPNPALAEAIVLSNNFRTALSDESKSYIRTYADLGERLGKPVFVFSMSDFTDSILFDPRVRVLRLSLYKRTMRANDISLPTPTADLGAKGITLRAKAAIPTVSFCGQAGYRTAGQWLKYYLKILLHLGAPARQLGVYWRRRMMAACRRSPLVVTNFIVRRAFSGAYTTIELDPSQAHAEFVQSIVDADFVLAPKGDGNYSNRFLETLSLGRIAVVIDTDIVLPFEDRIDYSKIVVRVPMGKVKDTPTYIREFYDRLSEDEWKARQMLARETFENYLCQDAFFARFFETARGKLS